ncbi:MAG TPA: integrase domain-containing protein [Burkholderiaceae bacterium]|nr:integrase domain-containing protein [Burkholderiaceae bacterium]
MEGNWRQILADVLKEHNQWHGKRNKVVSNLTMQQRADRLYSCFEELRELGYGIEDPTHIGERHLQALVDHWIARKHCAATIQTKLSHLRVFASWIGKPDLVKRAAEYVTDPNIVKRIYAAQTDASWSTRNIDAEGVIDLVRSIDPFVANQLLAELHFGLRVKEAVMLRPWRADAGSALLVDDGTKGGRPRVVPVRNQEQRDALNFLKVQVKSRNSSLADPSLTLKQAMTRYYVVMRAAGITRKGRLGVTSHGLRKEFANQVYFEMTGVPSPIQGGPSIDRLVDRDARLRLVAHLGHARESIGTAYLGPILNRERRASNDESDPATAIQ